MPAPGQLFGSICIMVGHKSISIDSLRSWFPNANKKDGFPLFSYSIWGRAALHFPESMQSSLLTRVLILFCAAQPKCHKWQHLASFHCTLEAFPSRQHAGALPTLFIWRCITTSLSSGTAENLLQLQFVLKRTYDCFFVHFQYSSI